MIVAEVTPVGKDRGPVFGIYLYVNMILILVAMGISTVVIWMQSNTEKKSNHTEMVKLADSVFFCLEMGFKVMFLMVYVCLSVFLSPCLWGV